MAYRENSRNAIPQQRTTWTESTDASFLREVVAWLKLLVSIGYFFSDEDLAANSHDDLICAEWRLRQAERRLRRG